MHPVLDGDTGDTRVSHLQSHQIAAALTTLSSLIAFAMQMTAYKRGICLVDNIHLLGILDVTKYFRWRQHQRLVTFLGLAEHILEECYGIWHLIVVGILFYDPIFPFARKGIFLAVFNLMYNLRIELTVVNGFLSRHIRIDLVCHLHHEIAP